MPSLIIPLQALKWDLHFRIHSECAPSFGLVCTKPKGQDFGKCEKVANEN